MADDSMEISSEFGHIGGDEDIDFDFDLTSAQVDEDYVLEDVAPNAEFGSSFNPQPSPAVGNDDLMIDEGEEAYQMDDTEISYDEEGHIMEHEAISFAATDVPHFGENNTDAGTHSNGGLYPTLEYANVPQQEAVDTSVHPEVSEDTLYDKDALHYEENPENEDTLQDEVTLLQDDVPHLVGASDQDADNPTLPSDHTSRTPTPPNRGSQSPGAVNVLRSPPASNPDDSLPAAAASPDHSDLKSPPPTTSIEANQAVMLPLDDDMTPLRKAPDVKVNWRAAEFDLFSQTELDDPDSFFLSDPSIIEKPLTDFFQEIREVIQDELTDGVELFIVVEDLHMETEENSTSNEDVTLGQILDVYEQLTRGDEAKSLEPLYINLESRHTLSKKITNLRIGAAEGKSLSELFPPEEQSESLNGSWQADGSKQGIDSNIESQVSGSASEAESPDDEEHDVIDHSIHQQPVLEAEEVIDTGSEYVQEAEVANDRAIHEAGITDTKSSNSRALPERQNSYDDENNEDDLIDYSDEEGQDQEEPKRAETKITGNRASHGTYADSISQCLKPDTCFCAKCIQLINAEYEAINEELRRRSVSGSTEDKLHEQSNTQMLTAADHEGDGLEQNGIEYEDNEEEFENGDEVNKEPAIDTFDAAGDPEEEHEDFFTNNETGGEGSSADDNGTYLDVFGSADQEYNDEDATAKLDEMSSYQTNHDTAPTKDASEVYGSLLEATFTEDQLEIGDTAESSVTVDADEIQYEEEVDEQTPDTSKNAGGTQDLNEGTENGLEIGQEDEIGYEDDEEEGEDEQDLTFSKNDLSATADFRTANGKRSRADVESDGAMSQSKDAKRRRS